MDIQKQFNAKDAEAKWYQHWMDQGYFKSTPDEREAYTIVMPPPNVTGVLHMGHALNNTVQDILIRRAKSQGYNTCWVPGTDHASIATEAKVVEMLHEKGIDKNNLSREEFLEHAWSWKEKYGNIILEQLKKLGCALDWDRTTFTLDDHYYKAVIDTFIDLYKKGKVYRAARMINWDPVALTALSDEEVYHKDTQSKLFYVSYKIKDSDETVTIATVRPETILGDTAICVHPEDPRFKHLIGQKAIIPIVGREVPIIADDYVDMEFGTGALKVTPAHDKNDHELGQKHQLEVIDIFNDNGTINQLFPKYEGKDREVVRKEIVEDLKAAGHLVKVEDYTNQVGFSERTHAVVEPKLSMQWWCKMDEMAEPALKSVMDDVVNFSPPKFKNLYRHWMENIRDWCISRQLWWGHKIPVWYLNDGSFVVAETEAEALEAARLQSGNAALGLDALRQDEDVLDTWASSWLWPITVFDGFNPDKKEIDYYYPTSDLVTGHDIIFFWVARMIMAGYAFKGTFPFKNVYFTGMVRDKQGRKMSKSLGNSPDPLDLIATYGADGVRVGMLLCSPAGGDLRFDESLPEQGRNFSNKIWNAFRLVKGWEVSESAEQPESARLAIEWFGERLQQEMAVISDHFSKYRVSDALMSVYTLFWDEFSNWFLEMIKPAYQQPIDARTHAAAVAYFDDMMHLLHPFMPFISEEIWQKLSPRKSGESIMVSQMPAQRAFDSELLQSFDLVKEAIQHVRTLRKNRNVPMREALELKVLSGEDGYVARYNPVLTKLVNLESVTVVKEKEAGAESFMVKSTEFFVPLAATVNVEEELEKLQAELKYTEGFINTVMKKLGNERFVAGAPEQVVANEQQKKADAEAKIAVLKERIAGLQ